jgi:MAP/microtubule affinity-regulating kinase
MEYVGGGSIHGYLKSKSKRRLTEDDAIKIIRQITEGLKYCHSRCITHRDIKLENLLLDDKNNIKMIDFGFSTCIPNEKKIKIFCGTPSYMAP